MKNFRKVVALALAFSMVLSTMSAFAAEVVKYEDEANTLYDLGLLLGYSSTEKELGLEDDLSRDAAMKLIVTMLGWEVDEDAASDFEDVADWAQPYVAVAVEEGITNGISDTEFGGSNIASMHELVTWYLRALGYDSSKAWTEAAALGMELQLVAPEELVAFDGQVQRDELAGVAYKALTVKQVGSESSLIEELVAKGIVEEDKAIAAGLINEPEPEALEVVDVKVLNLVQTQVIFNKAVKEESAEDASNYDIDKESIDAIELQEDGKSVIINHSAVDNQSEIIVDVDGVKSEDESEKVKDYEQEVRYLDFEIPEVVDVQIIGQHQVEVIFSEPVVFPADGDGIEIRDAETNKKLYVDKATQDNYSNKAIVTIYGKFQEGTYDVKITGEVKDYANYIVMPFTKTVEVVKDEEGPEVIDYEDLNATQVTLIFDENLDVDEAAKIDLADVYHTNAKNEAKTITVKGNKMTITFNDDETLPEGTAYVTIASDKVMDNWGNVAGTIIVEIEREKDVTAPMIEKIEVEAEDTIKVIFSETVEEDSAEDKDNYTVMNSEDKEAEIKSIVQKDDYVIIKFKDELSGVYELIIEGVKDLADNKCDDAMEIDVNDVSDPSFVSAKIYTPSAKEYTLIVKFDEPMATEGQYSVLDLGKYVLNNTTLSDVDDVEIDIIDDAKAVEIMIPNTSDDPVLLSGDKLSIAKVADEEGNTTNGLLAASDAVVDYTDVVSYIAEATAADTVVITFDDELAEVKADEFELYLVNTTDSSETKLTIASYEVGEDKNGNTTLTMTLKDELASTDVDGDTVNTKVVLKVTGNNSENVYGEPIDLSDAGDVIDKAAPVAATTTDGAVDVEVVKDVDGNNVIEIAVNLTEDIEAPSVELASADLVVTANSTVLVYGIDYTLDITSNASQLVVSLIENDNTKDIFDPQNVNGYDITIGLADTVNYIKDADDNKIADVEVEVDLGDYPEQ